MLAHVGARRSRKDSGMGRPTMPARRLDDANEAFIQLKSQLQAGQPCSVIEEMVERIEELLGTSGGNLVYAGYPYDPLPKM
jgi:hypothetical protein